MKPIRSISIFGDSILRGVVLGNDTRRYSVSNGIGMDSIAGMYSLQITNMSRFGCTIERGYEYIRKYLAKENDADVILLEFGGNDSDFNWSEIAANPDIEHFSNTPIEKFTEIYYSIIDYLKKHGIIPVLANLPPLCPERYFEWICRDGLDRDNILRWLKNPGTIYRYQENYSHTVDNIAARTGSVCIDLRGAFLKNRQIDALYCEDGIHPNECGQEIIRGALIETINNNKGAIYA